jgi:hypothetical protein
MPAEYARVSPEGEVLERAVLAETPPTTLAANKPRWLPVVVEGADFDPVSQVREGPVTTVEADHVLVAYSVRAKSEAEVATMIAAKVEALELEYRRRNALPFEAEVDGVVRTWHGDPEGMSNVEGINILIARDPLLVPNPRPWKPYEAEIVNVSHDGFAAIGLAYAARKDLNFATLQTLKATVRAMTDPAVVAAFDPLAGWDA